MRLHSEVVASGPGWFVQDVLCGAGPADRPFEEQHGSVCLAAVLEGTFDYRTSQGRAMLVPGAVMLGNAGSAFECGHEHGTGDRCLSFHYTPDYWDELVSDLPDARRADFVVPRLPPSTAMVAVTAVLEAAREGSDAALEDVVLGFAGAVVRALNGSGRRAPTLRRDRRDLARVSQMVRHIEATAHETSDVDLSIGALARMAGMSAYHFLRTFRGIVGMPPHQYVLRTRLNRAAVRLRTTDGHISAIALEAGFTDLSTFNRRFRRVMGMSPGDYRGPSLR
jgi:AraC-like DNA-binding protein